MKSRRILRQNYEIRVRNRRSIMRLIKRKINKIRAYKRLFHNFRINRFLRVIDALAYKRKFHNFRNKTYNHFPDLKKNLNFNTEKVVYIKGLPHYFSKRMLFHLFKKEGRINFCKIFYDDFGFPEGKGKIEFADPRVALKVIKKWNNAHFRGSVLKLGNKLENLEIENDMENQLLFRNSRNYSNSSKDDSSNYPAININTRNFNRCHNNRGLFI